MATPTGSSGDLPAEAQEGAGPPRVPRWVKVLGAVVVGLVLLAVILQVTGVAGDHGPGRHASQVHGSAGKADTPPIDGAPVLPWPLRRWRSTQTSGS